MRERIIDLGGSTDPHSIGKRCTIIDVKLGRRFYRIMIDCGTEFKEDGEFAGSGETPNFNLVKDKEIDIVLLTHADTDHCGALGALRASGLLKKDAPVISSPQAALVLPFVLADGERSKRHNILDTVNILNRRKVVPKPGVCEVLPGLQVFFGQNGHKPGSAFIIVRMGSGKKILFTGDMCADDLPITKGRRLLSQMLPPGWAPDAIGSTDLTYGKGSKEPLAVEVEKLRSQVRADLTVGKKIVIGAFSTGRGQCIPSWIGDIAKEFGVTIWLDGAIPKVYRIFQENRWSDRDLSLPEIGEGTGIHEIRDSKHRRVLLEEGGPAIFVTTSGMANVGPIIKDYIPYGIPRKDFSFYFTSWFTPSSNANRLVTKYNKIKEGDNKGDIPEVKLRDEDDEGVRVVLPLLADVYHFRLGSHGDLSESLEFYLDIVENCRGGDLLEFINMTHGSLASISQASGELRPFADQLFYGLENTVINV